MKTKLLRFFSPIVSALQVALLRLSMVDGAPGLSLDDLAEVLVWVKTLSGTSMSNAAKAASAAEWIGKEFGGKLPDAAQWPWLRGALGWVAYLIAVRLKIVS